MKERCTMTLAAACTAAILFTGAALAGGPQRDDDARDSATTARTAPKAQIQIKHLPGPIMRGGDVAASSLATADGGVAGGTCGPGAGDCCEANGTPGCEHESCCDLVCANDPICCFGDWDELCADQANSLCPECEIVTECGSPGTGSCCLDTGSPFCDDAECCQQICAEDPFCCNVNWDQVCADQASDPDTGCEFCQVPPNEACGPPNEASCCLAHAGTGCEDADCCNNVCFCDPFCCATQWDPFCAGDGLDDDCLCGPGACGVNNTPACNDLCEPGECGNPVNISCCAANIVSLQGPFCNDEACCNTVCAGDPFCCDTAWDYLCALDANDLCGCDVPYSNNTTLLASFTATTFPAGQIYADLLQMVDTGMVREISFSLVNSAADGVNSTLEDVELELLFMPVEVDGDGFVVEPDPNGPNVVVVPVVGEGLGLPPGFGFLALTITDDDGFFNPADLNDDFPLAMWAGLRVVSATFSAGGSITHLGQFVTNPPTAGFSGDFLWLSGFGLHGLMLGDGTPIPANYAWEIVTDPIVVECGDPDAGDCFVANLTPACNDAACCNTVCACDPFCCNVSWDDFCVGPNDDVPGCSALDLCGEPPLTGACNIPAPGECPADLTDDGNVGVADLLALLAAWGPNPGHPADLTGDGNVGVADLLALLAAWGPCPPGGTDCEVLSADDCAAADGAYQGDGTACP